MPEKKIHDITKEERIKLVSVIKGFELTIDGLGSFNEAVITRGGISVKEINPTNMMSKKINGLYFAGEMIDTDALTGGFNLQIAWSTAYAAATAHASPLPLIIFICLLLVTLVSMAIFRSPAVALMPDVTVKPLRSKANAVINLMGSFGGILVLVLGMVFATGSLDNALMSYTGFFAVIAGVMLIALGIFMLTVNEPRFVREMREQSRALGIEEDGGEADIGEKHRLTPPERRSLLFLLLSIILWFFGYNAITSKYSVYAANILHKDYNLTLIIAQAAAIVSYLPVGFISSRFGRKKTILAGVLILAVAFGSAAFMRDGSPTMLMNILFALAGIGWATINVNSFPMVVELATGADVGKYTGYYYTASQSAQIITPILSGAVLEYGYKLLGSADPDAGYVLLFPYGALFVALSFVTMLFVRHGDSKAEKRDTLEYLDVGDD